MTFRLFSRRSIPLSALLLPAVLLLTGCDQGKEPADVREVARQAAYSIRLANDGSAAMVGSLHHGGSLWKTQPVDRLFDWNHKQDDLSAITSSAFSPEGKFVATSDGRTIVLWTRDTGEAVWFWNAPGDIEDIALTGNGNFALLGLRDFSATLFDIKNGGVRQRLAHDGTVYSVSVSEDGLIGATGSEDLNARIWNLENGKLLFTLKHRTQVRTVQLSADGRLLFTSALNEPGKIWDVASGRLLKEIGRTRGHYSAARFSGNDAQLLTGTTAGHIELWNVSSGERQQLWRASNRDTWVNSTVMVEDVAFMNSGWLAAGTNGLLYFLH
ncbi:WD40 repeat domain-containing protein [Thalassolituus sp. LLYu03]|uniref:WD40 repeat domain-containing protein n=1 Tax=Thalassolituus sp. LLYu03 TaxID=3421656 RepID=UPI003D296CDA